MRRCPGPRVGRLADRALLALDDPVRAADDVAFLLLGRPLDHAMFHGTTETDIDDAADHAVDVVLAAHRVRGVSAFPC